MKKSFPLMRKTSAAVVALLICALPVIVYAQQGGQVDVLTVDGTIDAWADSYVHRGIGTAERDGAEALIMVLNTPGGTLEAMQNITTRMLNARVPIVVFVYPTGAGAGSAGTFILMAAHIAAMAPGTTVGAAHPVDVSGQDIPADARTKATNFAASMIQSIAEQRGRNADWAVRAVKESIAATAQEALDQKVIDLIADDPDDLLNKMDGMTVQTTTGEIILHTRCAGLADIDMTLLEQFFHTLVNPNIALVLLSIGLLAISVEIYHPGAMVPAIVGGICLVLAFVALGNLPVNWGGVILIFISVILFIIDIKVNSVVLTVGELVIFVLGALLLFTPMTLPSPILPPVRVSLPVVLALAGIMAVLLVFVLGAAVRTRKVPAMTGPKTLVGATGTAVSDLAPRGQVQVKGELWSAVAREETIQKTTCSHSGNTSTRCCAPSWMR
ncbi:MAG: nodulation protein NfeD [Anaerolineae bacterium]|nr:nodulation protein NfeD [Anaerolineae bacterium]